MSHKSLLRLVWGLVALCVLYGGGYLVALDKVDDCEVFERFLLNTQEAEQLVGWAKRNYGGRHLDDVKYVLGGPGDILIEQHPSLRFMPEFGWLMRVNATINDDGFLDAIYVGRGRAGIWIALDSGEHPTAGATLYCPAESAAAYRERASAGQHPGP